ncbi:hypothetical protein VB773_06360 [Haloarculaceae archaeon H-GB2-1]|nr:hypothetical protein [Haloarculaceae archaeon H-GB11]MEA5407230.1 hypothetical protein [Haloarculaceae archaeon H-GB2-1]
MPLVDDQAARLERGDADAAASAPAQRGRSRPDVRVTVMRACDGGERRQR